MRTGSFLNASFKGTIPTKPHGSASRPVCPEFRSARNAHPRVSCAATKRGTADKVLGGPASLLAIFHGLFPGSDCRLLGLIKQALPDGRGAQDRLIKPVIQRSLLLKGLTVLGQRAARRYLQLGARTA